LQRIFGITEPALLFDTLVHGGTLAAVLAVLWPDVWRLLRRPVQPMTGFLILGTIPAVIVALLFKDAIEGAFASGAFLGFAFLGTGALLLGSHVLEKRAAGSSPRGQGEMNWLDALIIGSLQALAIVPGLSRSGATLSGALSRRIDRDLAARFSFLLSVPAILGALVFQLKDLFRGSPGEAGLGGEIGPEALAAGTLAAGVVGFFSIRLMLKIVRERSLLGFAVYVAVLGALVLGDQYGTRFFFR
jgi:undecaprenyl-diphosphatase